VLENVGMTGIEPVSTRANPSCRSSSSRTCCPILRRSGPRTKGKTCIGCIVRGVKDGREKVMYICNICDHEACYAEVQSQAISYTTGVPAVIGAKMILEGHWRQPGVWNVEQCDPDPFMEDMNKYGLPWKVVELNPGFHLDIASRPSAPGRRTCNSPTLKSWISAACPRPVSWSMKSRWSAT
jgi:saccharopine dehydrogenase (NAD+, L-lysine forming)